MGNFFAHGFNKAGDLVSESQRQMIDGRNARPIVRVGVTDSTSGHPNQDVGGLELGSFNFSVLQQCADPRELNGFHRFVDEREIQSREQARSIGRIRNTDDTEVVLLRNYSVTECQEPRLHCIPNHDSLRQTLSAKNI